jgi:hypothetical protein
VQSTPSALHREQRTPPSHLRWRDLQGTQATATEVRAEAAAAAAAAAEGCDGTFCALFCECCEIEWSDLGVCAGGVRLWMLSCTELEGDVRCSDCSTQYMESLAVESGT